MPSITAAKGGIQDSTAQPEWLCVFFVSTQQSVVSNQQSALSSEQAAVSGQH
jgi:hypothetical protein